jgi:ketosteroid isomerase-like protein
MSPTGVPRKSGVGEQAVLTANRRFYAAFEALDLLQMDAVWLPEDWVFCVHPGWELSLGWDQVRETWSRIFAGTRRIQIALSFVSVHMEGEAAWVTCREHVTSSFASGFDEALVQATNIFVLREGQWRLVAHHGSPLMATQEALVQ